MFLLGSVALTANRSQAEEPTNLQGRLGLGVVSPPLGTYKNLFEMRLGLKTKRRDGMRAYLELKADEDSRKVSVQDAFADYRPKDGNFRLRGGRGKKILGWEYLYSASERLSIDRSLTYRHLSERAMVGRDFFLSYLWGTDHESDLDSSLEDPVRLIHYQEGWQFGASIHFDESQNSALILNAFTTPSPAWRFGLWTSLVKMLNQYRERDYLELVTSILFQSSPHRAALELFAGGDPYRTEVEKFFGGGRRVNFASMKAEYGVYLGRLNPYFIGTFLWRDLEHYGDHATEGTVGLRFFMTESFILAGEYRRTANHSSFDPTSLPYHYDTGTFLARYYF